MTAAALDEIRIPAPELRGAARELGSCHDVEVGIDGPAGTGKTFGTLYYIHVLLLKYPRSKWLVARKSNTDLAGSALATYRDDVLDPREGVNYFGGNKVRPAAYEYPNGSLLIVSGLDKPTKVKSLEVDGVYINEATECTIDDLEFCRMRLRKGKIPWQQVIMDFNPDAPEHWLNQRMNDGTTTRLLSRHEDNPRYHDGHDWTEDGRKYIFGVLGGLTGVRLARYRYGIWAASEGTVYEGSWDRARNVVKRFDIPLGWPRYMSLDFGYTHPFVAKWYAEDPDGRYYCYREIYMTRRLVEEHAKQVKSLSRWGEKNGDPLPRVIYADHDAEGREVFTKYTGLYTTTAHKAVSEGIQAMAARLRPAGDGKPRLMYFEDCLVERDQELVKAKKPTCTIEEFDSYVWDTRSGQKKGDVPVKESDHGMDTDRYLCAKDISPSGVSYFRDIWR
jgi:PBSX family phage terminase large subunit